MYMHMRVHTELLPLIESQLLFLLLLFFGVWNFETLFAWKFREGEKGPKWRRIL